MTKVGKVENVCREPVTVDQGSHLDELKSGQAQNWQWFKCSAGHVTVLQVNQGCHTYHSSLASVLVRTSVNSWSQKCIIWDTRLI